MVEEEGEGEIEDVGGFANEVVKRDDAAQGVQWKSCKLYDFQIFCKPRELTRRNMLGAMFLLISILSVGSHRSPKLRNRRPFRP